MAKIGVIEFGYHQPEESAMQVVQNVIDYTVLADKLGFSRMWFTEHHDFFKTSPWSNPEILLPLFLGMTKKIKIGIAGILINYHSPYNVALNFKLLANLFPGRVDLGFANGTPPDNPSMFIRQKKFKKKPDEFEKKIKFISDLYLKEEEMGLKYSITIPPVAGEVPNMFLLGSYFKRTQMALNLKLSYSKSLFHDAGARVNEKENVDRFKEAFYEKYGELPFINIAVPIICAKNKTQAKKIESRSGHPPLPNTLSGSMNYIEDEIYTLLNLFGIEEIILLDKSLDHRIKLETLHKIKERFIK